MATDTYNFKSVRTVPSAPDFIDVILSKTNRKTPTIVHPGYSNQRIRSFYMRKVQFTADNFATKLETILSDFPRIDDIHPFYGDLINVLYDKDHYKVALGQINTAKHLIETVAKDYLKLLKFGTSLYQCKQLKKAALGRMVTIISGRKEALKYLEHVRQHLARLPSIDPTARTLIVCGYPNVGKSSFVSKVTNADIDVQPYAFTTKSLYVGHLDYEYLRFQVLDTPGILDHPLEERNNIEMQSVTALAHLRSAVMFFLDISEECGYSIRDQCSLFQSLRPLFYGKPLMLVLTKSDLRSESDLNDDEKKLIYEEIKDRWGVTVVSMSTTKEEGVMETKNRACGLLLQWREDHGQGTRSDVIDFAVVEPNFKRDEKDRPAVAPDPEIIARRDAELKAGTRKLETTLEWEQGGPGVYNIDLTHNYQMANEEWKNDPIPEIMDGRNVLDFYDPKISERLEELEEEETTRQQGVALLNLDQLEHKRLKLQDALEKIKDQRMALWLRSKIRATRNVGARKIRRVQGRNIEDMANALKLDEEQRKALSRKFTKKRSRDEMEVDDNSKPEDVEMQDAGSQGPASKRQRLLSKSGFSRSKSMERIPDVALKAVLRRQRRTQANIARKGRKSESDRTIPNKMPKHLFAGKRGIGSTQRR